MISYFAGQLASRDQARQWKWVLCLTRFIHRAQSRITDKTCFSVFRGAGTVGLDGCSRLDPRVNPKSAERTLQLPTALLGHLCVHQLLLQLCCELSEPPITGSNCQGQVCILVLQHAHELSLLLPDLACFHDCTGVLCLLPVSEVHMSLWLRSNRFGGTSFGIVLLFQSVAKLCSFFLLIAQLLFLVVAGLLQLLLLSH